GARWFRVGSLFRAFVLAPPQVHWTARIPMRDAAGPGRHRRCRSGWLCAALLLLLGSVSAGCRGDRGRGAPASASAGSALAPLRAPSWLVALDVPGFGSANVAVPLGARSPRPLVIALHGDADRPEWPCGS